MQQFQLSKVVVLCFLLVLMAIGAIPGYLSGNWFWNHLPPVTNIPELNNLMKSGVSLQDRQTLSQRVVTIGGHIWSIQELQGNTQKSIFLLLLPQKTDKDKPQVEWMDIDGVMGWQTDSYSQLQFTVQPSAVQTTTPGMSQTIVARFFRGWTQAPSLAQTFAVVQWYAWPSGGNQAPIQWFWSEQIAQWQGRRVPWVAVCIQIPIAPLGDIEASRPLAESLAQKVQLALLADSLKIVVK